MAHAGAAFPTTLHAGQQLQHPYHLHLQGQQLRRIRMVVDSGGMGNSVLPAEVSSLVQLMPYAVADTACHS